MLKTFRLRTSDIQAINIDAVWKPFLLKEHKLDAEIGDYYFVDIEGNNRVMAKANFERLYAPVSATTVIPLVPIMSAEIPLQTQQEVTEGSNSWLHRLIPSLSF